jgi:beta-glucosidase
LPLQRAGEVSEAEIRYPRKKNFTHLVSGESNGKPESKNRVKGSISTEAHYQDAYKIATEAYRFIEK